MGGVKGLLRALASNGGGDFSFQGSSLDRFEMTAA
jgi:hypothetical protein